MHSGPPTMAAAGGKPDFDAADRRNRRGFRLNCLSSGRLSKQIQTKATEARDLWAEPAAAIQHSLAKVNGSVNRRSVSG